MRLVQLLQKVLPGQAVSLSESDTSVSDALSVGSLSSGSSLALPCRAVCASCSARSWPAPALWSASAAASCLPWPGPGSSSPGSDPQLQASGCWLSPWEGCGLAGKEAGCCGQAGSKEAALSSGAGISLSGHQSSSRAGSTGLGKMPGGLLRPVSSSAAGVQPAASMSRSQELLRDADPAMGHPA